MKGSLILGMEDGAEGVRVGDGPGDRGDCPSSHGSLAAASVGSPLQLTTGVIKRCPCRCNPVSNFVTQKKPIET